MGQRLMKERMKMTTKAKYRSLLDRVVELEGKADHQRRVVETLSGRVSEVEDKTGSKYRFYYIDNDGSSVSVVCESAEQVVSLDQMVKRIHKHGVMEGREEVLEEIAIREKKIRTR